MNQCVKSAHLWTIIFHETIDSWIILLLRFPVIVPYFHNFNAHRDQELELAMHALGQKMHAHHWGRTCTGIERTVEDNPQRGVNISDVDTTTVYVS